jgi:hypothetical protein
MIIVDPRRAEVAVEEAVEEAQETVGLSKSQQSIIQ